MRDPAASPDRGPARGEDSSPVSSPNPSSSPSPSPSPRRVLAPGRLPAAVVAIGVLTLALTLRATDTATVHVADGRFKHWRPVVAILGAILLTAIAARYARHRADGTRLVARAGGACAVLIGCAAFVTPIAAILLGHTTSSAGPQLYPTTPVQGATPRFAFSAIARPNPTDAQPGHDHTALIGQIIGCTLVAIAVAVVAHLVYQLLKARRRFAGTGTHHDPRFATLDDLDDLADAVDAAGAALDSDRATREAVIACYAAMEQSMSRAGIARREADAPEDLLKRATDAGLIRGGGGAKLTELFREARFSRHEIRPEQREAAKAALDEIAADLRLVLAARAERLAAAQAASGTSGTQGTSGTSGTQGTRGAREAHQ